MSFTNNADVSKRMVAEDRTQKPCLMEYESPGFMELPQCDNMDETLIVGEEIVVCENMDIKQEVCKRANTKADETTLYFEEALGISPGPVDYAESCSSTALPMNNVMKEDWNYSDAHKHSFLVSDTEGSDIEYECNANTNEDQDGDEETIATFVTAAGQQLALYAVEDSEEIFAVAVYEESGEPPTNFQFLMKADVERLIGEGAVRTVKKPTQIKKQLLTTQAPFFFRKDAMQEIPVNGIEKSLLEQNRESNLKDRPWNRHRNLTEDSKIGTNIKETSKMIYTTADKQSNVTYLMMDNCSTHDQCEDSQDDIKNGNDVIEQSTVQYILLEGEQSESELTFDEIQATLQNYKTSESRSSQLKKGINRRPVKDHDRSNRMMVVDSSMNELDGIKEHLLAETACIDSLNYEFCTHSSSNNNNNTSCYASNTLSERKQNLAEAKEDLLATLGDPVAVVNGDTGKLSSINGSEEPTTPSATASKSTCKTKRSRKQQLTSVNRDDSEIIIQPAALLTEDEDGMRKVGKRKRRISGCHSGYYQKSHEAKRLRKLKRKEVEIIEIDVDEEDSACREKSEVVEITIDDSKDKCSSDKENEIIMVGDSEDESRESDAKSTTILQCDHCSKSFRQQRALDTHLRVCSKSPSNALKLNAQKLKGATRGGDTAVKKQYACKICQEKFDVVVALARHARSMHSQRKKRRPSKSSVEEEADETKTSFTTDTMQKKVTMLRRTKKKRGPNSSWEVKKLSCDDCGRWFPSAALLNAHCLQHGTKKTEQQIRRCQICKKLIKSRLLFIRHLKIHSNVKQNTKSISSTLQKKLRTTRQVTRKITSLRKRGRPRKL